MDRYSKGVRMALGRAGIIRYPGPSLFAAFTIGAGVRTLGRCMCGHALSTDHRSRNAK